MDITRAVGDLSVILSVPIFAVGGGYAIGKTGLAYNTTDLTAYYKRNTASASVAIPLVAVATLGTFVSGGFKEIDATNMAGLYEFHVPNAAFASGADEVFIVIQNLPSGSPIYPVLIRIQLGVQLTQSERNNVGETVSYTTLTEAYPAVGVQPTFQQMLYMIYAFIAQFSISANTITAMKLDGVTPAMTATLNSSSAPTSRIRAT